MAFAINIVERALEKYKAPLYVYHEIVHNTYVVNDFKRRGVIFVESLDVVPAGQRIIFSAHGVPPSLIDDAQQRKLDFVDATCPLVTKVHNEAVKFSGQQYATILIGHKGHQEVVGTSGYVKQDLLHIVENEKDVERLNIDSGVNVAYITQTTLSVDETTGIIEKLKSRFPHLAAPLRADVCYATQNRQDAVKELADTCDLIIICGSPNSSNSNRLRETGEKAGVVSVIIDKAEEFPMDMLDGKKKVGVSSGASVPRTVIVELVQKIQLRYPGTKVNSFSNPEKNIVFPLPEL